jgi:hypothetical protein
MQETYKAKVLIECELCEYEKYCELRKIASDLIGCMGHGVYNQKIREEQKRREKNGQLNWNNIKLHEKEDFKPGDHVIIKRSLINSHLPRYIENSPMTVLRLGRDNVICDYDGGKPFSVPPGLLEFVTEE